MESKDEIPVLPVLNLLVFLFQTMLSFLVILFVRKLYVQNNTFKQRTNKNLCHVRLPYFVLRTCTTQTITDKLTKDKLSDLLKGGFYFSIQPDELGNFRKNSSFIFINKPKSEETKSQVKGHLSYLDNSYFYNCKPSPRLLHQHRVLRKS